MECVTIWFLGSLGGRTREGTSDLIDHVVGSAGAKVPRGAGQAGGAGHGSLGEGSVAWSFDSWVVPALSMTLILISRPWVSLAGWLGAWGWRHEQGCDVPPSPVPDLSFPSLVLHTLLPV